MQGKLMTAFTVLGLLPIQALHADDSSQSWGGFTDRIVSNRSVAEQYRVIRELEQEVRILRDPNANPPVFTELDPVQFDRNATAGQALWAQVQKHSEEALVGQIQHKINQLYEELVSQYEMVNTAKRLTEVYTARHDAAKELFNRGLINEDDLRTVEFELLDHKRDTEPHIARYSETSDRLRMIMGISAGAPISFSGLPNMEAVDLTDIMITGKGDALSAVVMDRSRELAVVSPLCAEKIDANDFAFISFGGLDLSDGYTLPRGTGLAAQWCQIKDATATRVDYQVQALFAQMQDHLAVAQQEHERAVFLEARYKQTLTEVQAGQTDPLTASQEQLEFEEASGAARLAKVQFVGALSELQGLCQCQLTNKVLEIPKDPLTRVPVASAS